MTTALEYSPETYTVVAMYKRLVVGIALISPPPDEAYITYLAVKSGWENSGIAQYVRLPETARIVDSLKNDQA